MVCLSCTATGERVCLAAEGFGNRHCYLENIADKNIPPDLSQCVFVIEQALSVRALQELVTAAGTETVSCILVIINYLSSTSGFILLTIPAEEMDGYVDLPPLVCSIHSFTLILSSFCYLCLFSL